MNKESKKTITMTLQVVSLICYFLAAIWTFVYRQYPYNIYVGWVAVILTILTYLMRRFWK